MLEKTPELCVVKDEGRAVIHRILAAVTTGVLVHAVTCEKLVRTFARKTKRRFFGDLIACAK